MSEFEKEIKQMVGAEDDPEKKLEVLVEIKNTEIDAKIRELDLKLKQFDLEHKPSFWAGVFASPGFLAALVALLATIGTSVTSYIITQNQLKIEEARHTRLLRSEDVRNEFTLFAGVMTSASIKTHCEMAATLGHRLIKAHPDA